MYASGRIVSSSPARISLFFLSSDDIPNNLIVMKVWELSVIILGVSIYRDVSAPPPGTDRRATHRGREEQRSPTAEYVEFLTK